MSGPILVTGASSGIGLETALSCAARGFQVVASMRNLERRDELERRAREAGAAVAIEQLDVTDVEVRERVQELVLKYGPIFGLVNNAGIAIAGPFEEQSDRDVREQFETNVFGAMAVTRALLPSMRASRRGRIVMVSSISGRLAFPGLGVYAASKHALEGFSEALRIEVAEIGIDVCVVEPGTFRTAIFFANQRRATHLDPAGPYAELIRRMERIVMEDAERAPPPSIVGEKIAELLSASRPALRVVVGTQARALELAHRLIPDRWFASGMRRFIALAGDHE
jgi:NAD(P)-dependent dehydrogenase (short-subunit alcohol dehydrogenase family)